MYFAVSVAMFLILIEEKATMCIEGRQNWERLVKGHYINQKFILVHTCVIFMLEWGIAERRQATDVLP